MVAVSNTSPLSNLAIIGRLDLLHFQFDAVWIPNAVRTELQHIPNPLALASLDQAFRSGWLRHRMVGHTQFAAALANDLDVGEAEAIALASELRADVLLIDEKKGREIARKPVCGFGEHWVFSSARKRQARSTCSNRKSRPSGSGPDSTSSRHRKQRS